VNGKAAREIAESKTCRRSASSVQPVHCVAVVRSDAETGRTQAVSATAVRSPFAMPRQTLCGSGMAVTLGARLTRSRR
jgi:hypothetical protein